MEIICVFIPYELHAVNNVMKLGEIYSYRL